MSDVSRMDYGACFMEVCSGLGVKPNEIIIQTCCDRTYRTMDLTTLERITKYLLETSKKHPTYSDFINAAYMNGFSWTKKDVGIGYTPGSCTLKTQLYDGSGWISVDEGIREIIMACPCQLGERKNRKLTEVAQKTHCIRVWDEGMKNKGYQIRYRWSEMSYPQTLSTDDKKAVLDSYKSLIQGET